ncbi:MAG TPA: fatty acid desaturase [Steroidobacteraceae bacterium]|nr:fatty acid desaturase [Steroidobacteraceae bacterium]
MAIDAVAGRRLLFATRPFAHEWVGRSWWYVGSTFALMFGALVTAGLLDDWPLRTAFSILGALVMVRAFILYHDFMHGSILRGSKWAARFFRTYGAFALTPERSWKKSHNYHHAHVGQLSWVGIGAFPIVSTKMWNGATRSQRLRYRATRHPLIILFGYVTIFACSICLLPLLREPRRHWDSALALLAHLGLIAIIWLSAGFATAFFAIMLPMAIASMLGSYLFFAQHSFKGMYVASPEAWSFYRSALGSSSYIRLNRPMRWFTGNIGYHHVHHLNVGIPFYRLPEAMAAIPKLQTPVTISLRLRDVVACFRSCLWDEERQQMVSYREARRPVNSHAQRRPATCERADALQLTKWEDEGGAIRSGSATPGIVNAPTADPARVPRCAKLP